MQQRRAFSMLCVNEKHRGMRLRLYISLVSEVRHALWQSLVPGSPSA
jgi:hypothetical protein